MRTLRDLRGRVKAARAALSDHPDAKEALRADWHREAAFYERFGISQAEFRQGVQSEIVDPAADAVEGRHSRVDGTMEVRERETVILPDSAGDGEVDPHTLPTVDRT